MQKQEQARIDNALPLTEEEAKEKDELLGQVNNFYRKRIEFLPSSNQFLLRKIHVIFFSRVSLVGTNEILISLLKLVRSMVAMKSI